MPTLSQKARKDGPPSGIYSNSVLLFTLGSIEAVCLARKGSSGIDVNEMQFVS